MDQLHENIPQDVLSPQLYMEDGDSFRCVGKSASWWPLMLLSFFDGINQQEAILTCHHESVSFPYQLIASSTKSMSMLNAPRRFSFRP